MRINEIRAKSGSSSHFGFVSTQGNQLAKTFIAPLPDGVRVLAERIEGSGHECGDSRYLAIPFFEASNGTQQARLVGFPNTFGGALNFTTTSEVFGGEGYARVQWCQGRWGQIDVLAGYQFARINESLIMNSAVTDLAAFVDLKRLIIFVSSFW